MRSHHHYDLDDPEVDINPFTMLPPQQQEEEEAQFPQSSPKNFNGTVVTTPPFQDLEQQNHFLSSINSNLVIRQLPSEGLSFQLWPAATSLVNLLDRHCSDPTINSPLFDLFKVGNQRGRYRILELGSGTGLVGLAAAAILGANVTVTDLRHVLPNLQYNIEANAGILEVNSGVVNAAALSWGETEEMEAIGRDYDYILASDVVYHDHLYEPLLKTLEWFLLGNSKEKEIVFVMAHLRRWKKESAFFKKAKKVFDVEVIHTDDPPKGSRIGVVVYTFVAKAKARLKLKSGKKGNKQGHN